MGIRKIGILGSGQLSRMLCEVAPKLGLETWVYSSDQHAPATPFATHIVVGSETNSKQIEIFLEQVDCVGFENEFFSAAFTKSAQQWLKQNSRQNFFAPALEVLEKLRNKQSQKEIFVSLKLPTAPYCAPLENEALEAFVSRSQGTLGTDCVYKWALGGYDGKGVLINAGSAEVKDFLSEAQKRAHSFYAESKVPYKQELALIAVQGANDFVSYPLVLSKQQNGICFEVKGPASAWGVDLGLEKQATAMAQSLAHKLQIQGAFGIEFFESQSGQLLINEMAPRVHNSGHYSQDVKGMASQFENHMRALAGLDLLHPSFVGVFGMINLIGVTEESNAMAPEFKVNNSQLHWYDKTSLKKLRKMGHINCFAPSPEDLNEVFKEVYKKLSEDGRFLTPQTSAAKGPQ